MDETIKELYGEDRLLRYCHRSKLFLRKRLKRVTEKYYGPVMMKRILKKKKRKKKTNNEFKYPEKIPYEFEYVYKGTDIRSLKRKHRKETKG